MAKPTPVKLSDGKMPVVDYRQFCRLRSQGQFGDTCKAIVQVLQHLQKTNFKALDRVSLAQVNDFVATTFAILSDPEFKIPNEYVIELISRAHLFANAVAISSYGTTDAVLQHVLLQSNNLHKLLFLYSVRNNTNIPVKKLFDADSRLASLWYLTYMLPTIGAVTEQQHRRLEQHLADFDNRYVPIDHRLSTLYFTCTYFGGEQRYDAKIKAHLNKHCRKVLKDIKIVNTPSPTSIAIVTSKWFPYSAVHKSCAPLIDKLKGKYKLTLVHTGHRPVNQMAKDYFDKVVTAKFVSTKNGPTLVSEAFTNDFQLAYFPDVGMTDESIWLSNARLAPVQVTSYGHPVSTFGSEIDYFVVGSESERLEDLDDNYSETPIILPGLGAAPVWPAYMRKNPSHDGVIANCVWGPDKYNFPMVDALKTIAKQCGLKYSIFPSRGIHRYNAYIPFKRDLLQHLGEYATLYADFEYMEYMEAAEYGDFSINSYPFGGYNTVVESLYLGKPVVTLEGDRFYNLAASALLHRVGLGELIATNITELQDICIRLTLDTDYLNAMKSRLASTDLKAAIFDQGDEEPFVRAIEHIITSRPTEPVFASTL